MALAPIDMLKVCKEVFAGIAKADKESLLDIPEQAKAFAKEIDATLKQWE